MRKFLLDWLIMFAICMVILGVGIGGWYLAYWLYSKFGVLITVVSALVFLICTAYALDQNK